MPVALTAACVGGSVGRRSYQDAPLLRGAAREHAEVDAKLAERRLADRARARVAARVRGGGGADGAGGLFAKNEGRRRALAGLSDDEGEGGGGGGAGGGAGDDPLRGDPLLAPAGGGGAQGSGGGGPSTAKKGGLTAMQAATRRAFLATGPARLLSLEEAADLLPGVYSEALVLARARTRVGASAKQCAAADDDDGL